MDLFKWSVPFLIEKIGDMMEHLMARSRAADIEPTNTDEPTGSLDESEVQAILAQQQAV